MSVCSVKVLYIKRDNSSGRDLRPRLDRLRGDKRAVAEALRSGKAYVQSHVGEYLICRRCGLALEIRNLNALCRALASGVEKDLSG